MNAAWTFRWTLITSLAWIAIAAAVLQTLPDDGASGLGILIFGLSLSIVVIQALCARAVHRGAGRVVRWFWGFFAIQSGLLVALILLNVLDGGWGLEGFVVGLLAIVHGVAAFGAWRSLRSQNDA
ncbi:MAG: hypothetical protein ACPHID_01580 [Thermoplasmatota archaeon]